MPWGSVLLKPGVDVEKTPTLNEAGLSTSSLVRFKNGLVQKIGGWQKFYANAVGGIPRGMHAWQDLNEADHLAVGTTTTLGIVTDDDLTVIDEDEFDKDVKFKFKVREQWLLYGVGPAPGADGDKKAEVIDIFEHLPPIKQKAALEGQIAAKTTIAVTAGLMP